MTLVDKFIILAAVSATLLLGFTWSLSYRAGRVLECIQSMPEAAPLIVSQANPDYAYEAAVDWCYRFVSYGGKVD